MARMAEDRFIEGTSVSDDFKGFIAKVAAGDSLSRDEASRADRSPGEFYQLDFEMSFVTQDDVFAAIEPVLHGVFDEFKSFNRETPRQVTPFPFPRIPYAEAILTYGTDKPDLRNPLKIYDVGEVFAGSDFKVFAGIVAKGGVVRAIRAPKAASQPRSFFDKLNSWAQGEGKPGLGYITLEGGVGKGPIAKFVADDRLARLKSLTGAEDGDSVFFVADQLEAAWKFAGLARTKVGQELGVIAEGEFRFCWIVDFPMFEYDDKLKKIDKYLIGQFAYLLQQMKSVKEGEGTLLDHSLVMFGNGLGDGNAPSHHNLPIILAGGGFKHGRHIAFKRDNNTPLCNLFVTMLQRLGVETESFASSSGELSALG